MAKKKITADDLGLKSAPSATDDKDVTAPSGPPSEVAAFWAAQLDDARKREKAYRKLARKVVKIYEAEEGVSIPFNILYANTETLLPVLYSQPPRPVVKRRQRSNNDIKALMASRVSQRMLEYLLNDGLGESPGFDDLAQRSVLQALTAGRGIMRFKYEAEFEKITRPPADEAVPAEDAAPADSQEERVTNEYISAEYVEWDKVLMGYARVWKQVPWLAFEHAMTRDELVKYFGEKVGKQVPLNMLTSEESKDDADDDREEQAPKDSDGAKLAQVYEIWDKVNKKVIFYAPSYEQEILKQLDDPLSLSGFYPCAEPLTLFLKVRSMVPQPLYTFYEEQADELNRITVRINKIVSAMKIRGFYDSTIKGMEKLLEQEDNILLPAENVAAMLQGQTLDKAIWLMPLEKLIAVLQQLYLQRNQVKTLIYEVTGLSDILRGASAASETLGAQEMKQNWATIRIKRMQRAVMKYLRANLRVMAELAVGKLSSDTIAQMTGVKLPTAEDKQMAQTKLQQWQAQQQAQLAPPPPPMPGAPGMAPAPSAPPAPPKPQGPPPEPPQDIVQTLATPTMDEVMEMLRNDLMRSYLIDIETNSMLESEASEDKAQVGEFLNAMAQFMSGAAPLILQGVLPFDAAQAILVNVTRRFRMGDEVEESLMKMKAPEAPPDEKGSGKDIEGEKALMQAKIQMQQEDLRIKKELGQLEIELKRMQMQLEQEKMELERRKVQDGHQTHQMDMQHKTELAQAKHAQSLLEAQMPAQAPVPAGAPGM